VPVPPINPVKIKLTGSIDIKNTIAIHFLLVFFQSVCISSHVIRFLAKHEKYIAKGILNQFRLYKWSYICEGIFKNKSKPTKIKPKIIPTNAMFKEGEIPVNAINEIK
jgi:hypothetical protein